MLEKEETRSTNDDARELALDGAPHGSAVLARRQLAGRGRAGRSFSSPEGGLYLSVVLRPRSPPAQWGPLPLIAGAAAACALRADGFPAELKWPNDLLLRGRKVGGILVETRFDADPFAIVGVGINVDLRPSVEGATALAEHGRAPDTRALARAIHAALLARIARLDTEGPRGVLAEARALCGTLGRRIAWEKGDGVAIDLAEDGSLVVDVDGARSRVVAGDVRISLV